MDLVALAERLTEVEWAEQARDVDPGQAVDVRPVWVMRAPGVALGRKTADVVPVRCEYDGDTVTYRIVSLGVDETGRAEPQPHDAGQVVSAGRIARWELIEHFRAAATAEARTAHASLALSVGKDLLSNATLVGIVDDFILDEFPTKVLPHVNAVGTCRKVDPERWLRTTIRTRMRELVRQRLDDPREGVAIREASAALKTTDIDRIVQHFESDRPRRSRVTSDAVRRALSLWMSADPMLAWRHIEPEETR